MTPPLDHTTHDGPQARWSRRCGHRPGGDAGLAVLELVIATTMLISVLLLVVGFGRYTQAQQLVEQAAGAAARAASLDATPAQAARDARQTATDSVASAGQSCTNLQVSVDTSAFHPGGQVSVTVACTVDLSQMSLAGFGPNETVRSTQTAPLEVYRQIGGGTSVARPHDTPQTTGEVPA